MTVTERRAWLAQFILVYALYGWSVYLTWSAITLIREGSDLRAAFVIIGIAFTLRIIGNADDESRGKS